MNKNLLIPFILMMTGFLGTAVYGSEIHDTGLSMNGADSGNQADDRNQTIFADFFRNWVNKGVDLTDDGKYKEALQAFDTAFRYLPGEQDLHARAWAGRARVYDALEDYDQALVASDEVINISPDDPTLLASAWVTRGIALRYLNRYNESLTAFDQALILDPDDSRTRQLRIFTLRLMNADG